MPQELNGKQLLFVAEYLKCNNATQAAINAGYSPKTAQEQGSRLLSNVMVQERVKAAQTDIQALIAKEATDALKTIVYLARNARNESVKLKAAMDLLDRAGYKPTDKVDMKAGISINLEGDVKEWAK